MKRIFSAVLCLSLVLCAVQTASAHDAPDVIGVICAAISAPDLFYVPSGNIEDYSVTREGDMYAVWCFGERVGTAWTTSEGAVGYTSVDKHTVVMPMQTIYETRRLGVPALMQPTDTTCWAACCAMLIRYYENTNVTPAQIAALCPNATNGGTWQDMDAVYNGVYHLNVGQVTRTLMFSEIWTLLGNDRPIHIGGNVSFAGSSIRHSMLIIGAATGSSNNVLYVNEPQSGTCFAYDISNTGWGASTADKGIEFRYYDRTTNSYVKLTLTWDKSRWKNV